MGKMENFGQPNSGKKREKQEMVVNFEVGSIVEWDPKMFSDPVHPRGRTIKDGAFEVVEILVMGKKNREVRSIGKIIEQVVRIRPVEVKNKKNKLAKKEENLVEEDENSKIKYIDVSSRYLRLKK